jgi:type I restriction enzyme S subunit
MAGERRYIPASEFCTSVRDGTHDSPKAVAKGRKLVTSRHLTTGRLDVSDAYLISDEDFQAINKRSKVDRWDVLISMIGTVGEPCLIKEEPDFAIKNIGLFKTKNEADGKWLYYFLRSKDAQQNIRAQSRGTTQQYIPLGTLRDLPILVANDPEEQKAIASVLGALDDKIEVNRRMNATLEAMARALFQSWFVDFDPVRAKSEGSQPEGMDAETAALFPSEFVESELGKIPKGWEVVSFETLASVRGGKQLPTVDCLTTGKFPVFGANGVMGYATTSTHDGFVIAFGRVGAYCGSIHWALEGAWINNNASAVVPLQWPAFVLQLMLNIDFHSMRTGSAQPFIPNGSLSVAKVLRPPSSLAEAFCRIVGEIRKQQFYNEKQSNTLAALRDTLLPKLLSGELRVGHLEPLPS